MNVADNVARERILGLERGTIFFLSDFDDIATDTAIRQPLSRTTKRGEIIRVSRGIYCYPRSNPCGVVRRGLLR